MRIIPFGVAGLVAMMLAAVAAAQTGVPLQTLSPSGPISGSLIFEGGSERDGRMEYAVVLDLPRLFDEMDAAGAARGNVGGEEERLFWVGPTHVKGAEAGAAVVLGSRVRFELWEVNDLFKTRIFEDTKGVDVLVRPVWDPDASRLRVEITLLNIQNVPGSLEQLVQSFGVSFTTTLDLFAVEDPDLLEADLSVLPLSAEALERGLRLRMAVSLDRDAAGRLLARLLPDAGLPDPAGLPDAVGRLLFGAPD